ncbi:MAG: type II toxin-antitoxin system VapC family toxin [Propionibacteriaceae bacterium]|jgi:predicted nucleic acid-binding protein|nr:type II toxin-antitoxin system VapC family toxin [Propionibacteriaceae bacterium]
MIILDTNIVSALFVSTHQDHRQLRTWCDACLDQEFRICAPTLAEIEYGIAILPAGARKEQLIHEAHLFLSKTAQWILPFGARDASEYAIITAQRRPISIFDAQIAAITRTAGATLATRNIKDFENCGITLVNPYQITFSAQADHGEPVDRNNQ